MLGRPVLAGRAGAGECVQRLELPRLAGSGRGLEPAAGVLLAHADELFDEVAVEEQVTQQLAVGGAVVAEQAVEQREVRRAQRLQAAVTGAKDPEREVPDRAGALRREE